MARTLWDARGEIEDGRGRVHAQLGSSGAKRNLGSSTIQSRTLRGATGPMSHGFCPTFFVPQVGPLDHREHRITKRLQANENKWCPGEDSNLHAR